MSSTVLNLLAVFISIIPGHDAVHVPVDEGLENSIVAARSIGSGPFCYDLPTCDERSWAGSCNTGTSQSPINIWSRSRPEPGIPVFRFNPAFTRDQSFSGTNNGYAAQFGLPSNSMPISFTGGNLSGTYTFREMHFHWAQRDLLGSEHTLDGRAFPLELHMVFYKSSRYMTIGEAVSSKAPDALAVLAVFFRIQDPDNPVLGSITRALPSLVEPLSRDANITGSVNLYNLLPRYYSDFVRYSGSLTTPGCDEVVAWSIFRRPLFISRNQLSQFRALKNSYSKRSFNYRRTQSLNKRVVQTFKSTFRVNYFAEAGRS